MSTRLPSIFENGEVTGNDILYRIPGKPSFVGNSKKAMWWFFTIFENDFENWKKLLENPKVEYAVWQLEEAPDTGKEHFQACLKFKTSDRFDWIKKQLPQSHIEHCKSPEAAIKYCKKAESRVDGPWEHGTYKNGNGKRIREREEFDDAVRNGATLRELAELNLGRVERGYKGIKFVQSLTRPKSHAGGRTVILLWGEAGTGKSDYAFRQYPDAFLFPQSASFTHIDGYDGEAVAIIDDITDDQGRVRIPFDVLLKFLGDQPYRSNWRGCPCWWNPRVVVITANYHWQHWYPDIRPESRGALGRRIDLSFNVSRNTFNFGNLPIKLPDITELMEHDRLVLPTAASTIQRAWRHTRSRKRARGPMDL